MADTILKGGAKILGAHSPGKRSRGPYSLRPLATDLAAQESFATRRSKNQKAVEEKIGHLREAGTFVTAIRAIVGRLNETIKLARGDSNLSQEGVRDAIQTAKTRSLEAYQEQVFGAFGERREVARRQAGELFTETAATAALPETEAERLDLLLESQIFPSLSPVDQLGELEALAEAGDRLRLRPLLRIFEATNDGSGDAGRIERLRSMLVSDATLAQQYVDQVFDSLAVGLETFANLIFKLGVDDPQASLVAETSIAWQALNEAGFTGLGRAGTG